MLEPMYPNKATGIINGEASGVLNWDDIAYPSFYRVYRELSTNYWIPDEVPMSSDIKDYAKLSEGDKYAFDSIIGLLATLDSPQTRFIGQLAPFFSDVAVQTNLAMVGFQEAIHNQSYSYILSSITDLKNQKRIFDQARVHPIIIERNKPIMEAYDKFFETESTEDLLHALVQSSILEGINFYSGFAYFYNLGRHNKMNGTVKIITFINRDELAHSKFISEIIQAVLHENPEYNNEKLNAYVYGAFKHAVDLEIEWSREVLADIDGVAVEDMVDYVKYRANKMLGMLGLEALYAGYEENTMGWIRAYEDNFTGVKADFFESKVSSYKKGSGDNNVEKFDDFELE